MKTVLKKIVYGIAWIVSLFCNNGVVRMWNKFVCLVNTANFRRKLKGKGKHVSIGRRNTFENLRGVTIGNNFSAGDGLWLATYPKWGSEEYHPCIRIGDGVSFSRNCHVGAIGDITIGDRVLIGSNVLINDHAHGESIATDEPRNKLPLVTKGSIEIGDNTWICDNVCILPGVHIGKNCIIGANSVVTKSFDEDGVLIAGNPAKIIKKMEVKTDA